MDRSTRLRLRVESARSSGEVLDFFTVGLNGLAEGSVASPIGAAEDISSSGLDRCDRADPRNEGR